jgi:hypothetical protein
MYSLLWERLYVRSLILDTKKTYKQKILKSSIFKVSFVTGQLNNFYTLQEGYYGAVPG